VIAVVAAGCESSSGSAPTQTVVTVTQAANDTPQSTPTSVRNGNQATVVPSLAGLRLDIAESKLQQAGLGFKEIGGGMFGIVVKANWQVCQQQPAAGAAASGQVQLVVDRPGECTSVSGGAAKVIPNVTGQRLDVAEANLDAKGIAYQEVGGGLFGVVVTSHWQVCQQDPSAGSTGESVKLIVDREGDC
jgi:hypothetical protein